MRSRAFRSTSPSAAGLVAAVVFSILSLRSGRLPASTSRTCLDCEGVPPASATLSTVHWTAAAPGYERGVLLLKVKPGVDLASPPASLAALNARWGLLGYAPLLPAELSSPAAFEQVLARYPLRTQRSSGTEPAPRLDLLFKLRLNPQSDMVRAAGDYSSDPNVEYAQPSRFFQTSFIPGDQFYETYQWGPRQIRMPEAWDRATGAGVTIAIVDSGIEVTHPDLAARIWTNPDELADGIDNDHNGIVDDLHGWDFYEGKGQITDPCGHGTHVAGIAGAITNSEGIAGIAHSAAIMPVRVIDEGDPYTGTCGTAEPLVVMGIQYAVAEGADIINLSLGGPGSSPAVDDAILSAIQAGVVVVAAAGNRGAQAYTNTPARNEFLITVGAMTQNDTRAGFSNYGVKLDVGAPGVDILSTIPDNSFVERNRKTFTGLGTGTYLKLPGTSMAAPHVAGLAALLLQQHPTWTMESIRQAIRRTADDVAPPGIDLGSGFGRINAAAATALGPVPPPAANILSPANGDSVSGSVDAVPVHGFAGNVSDVAGGSYVLQIGRGEVPTAWNTFATGTTPVTGGLLGTLDASSYGDGWYVLRLLVTDSAGVTSEDRNLILLKTSRITDPVDALLPGSLMNGVYPVKGYVRATPTLVGYTLSYRSGCQESSAGFTQFWSASTGVGSPGAPGALGDWTLAPPMPQGEVLLRLNVDYGDTTFADDECVMLQIEAVGWPVSINHSPALKSAKIANLDGTGDKEIIVGASVFDSSGALHPGWTDFPGLGRTNPAIVNLDGGPDLEIIAAEFQSYGYDALLANGGGPIVNAYKSDKSVVWSHTVTSPGGTPGHNNGIPSSIAVADVDGDGLREVVFSVYFKEYQPDPEGQTWIYVLDAASGTQESVFSIKGKSIASLALADLNHDGAVDIIADTYQVASQVGRIYALTHSGLNLSGWPFTVPSKWSKGSDPKLFAETDPVVADFSRHGKYQVLVRFLLFEENGQVALNWPPFAGSVSAGAPVPFDQDCALEAAVGGTGLAIHLVYKIKTAEMIDMRYVNASTKQIDLPDDSNQPGNAIVADITGDGKPEIIKPYMTGVYDSADYAIFPPKRVPLHGTPFAVRTEIVGYFLKPIMDKIRSTPAVNDIDNDGKNDVVLVAGGLLHWWKFITPSGLPVDSWPEYQHDLRNTGTLLSIDYTHCPTPTLPAGD